MIGEPILSLLFMLQYNQLIYCGLQHMKISNNWSKKALIITTFLFFSFILTLPLWRIFLEIPTTIAGGGDSYIGYSMKLPPMIPYKYENTLWLYLLRFQTVLETTQKSFQMRQMS